MVDKKDDFLGKNELYVRKGGQYFVLRDGKQVEISRAAIRKANLKAVFSGAVFKGMAKGAKEAWTDGTLAVARRMLSVTFRTATMSPAQRRAYEAISATEDDSIPFYARQDRSLKLTVPANVSFRRAAKALKLIKLENDPRRDLHVTWEGNRRPPEVIREKAPKRWIS